MAATLPAINLGSKVGPPVHPKARMSPTPPAQGKLQSPRVMMISNNNKRLQGKRDREVDQRRERLRAELPDLTKRQTSSFRNSFKHNLCLDMLKDGFHESFAELFALIRNQNEERERAGPESAIWNMTQLQDEHDKLNMLKQHLTDAETAHREGDYVRVYHCQYTLARYFQQKEDKWLADHFYTRCLETSCLVKGDDGKFAAEGHCNVGLALEESGACDQAADNFERFYELTKDKPNWVNANNVELHVEACNLMSRIYTTLAEVEEKKGNLEEHQEYLDKAYHMAKEGEDKKIEGEASLRLGMAYEKNGNPTQALTYLNKYLDICRVLNDKTGIGQACEAIAKSYESQGKVEESIKYLEMFVQMSEQSKDDKSLSRACSALGAIFNSLGRYEQATSYFNKAYNISRALNDSASIGTSRVQFGIAAAHKMLANFARHVQLATKPAMERLAEWKDNRGDDFDKKLGDEPKEKEDN